MLKNFRQIIIKRYNNLNIKSKFLKKFINDRIRPYTVCKDAICKNALLVWNVTMEC